jgi:hypothetical protein
MRQVMVRYKVKPERLRENEELIRAVYEELRHTEPAGLRYATFKMDDGVSFVHLAVFDAESDGSSLSNLRAFQEFRQHLEDRSEEGPVRTELDRVDSFRLVGDSLEH